MSVHAGSEQEYVRRHQPIWPELEEMLLAHGIRTYSIFLDPKTRELFAYVEFETEQQWLAIAETEVCRRWWSSMSALMPSRVDRSPVTAPLDEVFHIERKSGP
jgi:L-rhamnose mutarotase